MSVPDSEDSIPAPVDCGENLARPVERADISLDFSAEESSFMSHSNDIVRLKTMHEYAIQRRAHEVKAGRQAVKNRLAMILIWAFVLSLPFLIIVLALSGPQEVREQLNQVYIHWLTILASLAGAAVGFNAGVASQQE